MRPIDRILVPLDGSRLAESALPPAAELAGALGARLVLLHVLERNAPPTVHGQAHLVDAAGARKYADATAERLRAGGIAVDVHVHEPGVGDVAASIAGHCVEIGVGLVVLCTHGSGGLRDLLLGSIAQQTLRRVACPVLVVRPEWPTEAPQGAEGGSGLRGRCWIVAVEPARHGPTALPLAGALADACDARLHLLTVVPTLTRLSADRFASAVFSPSATTDVLEMEAEETRRFLEGEAEPLRADGVDVQVELRRGKPLDETIIAVQADEAALVVVATHGRSGVSGLFSGSFAAGLLPKVRVPVLLVPLPARRR